MRQLASAMPQVIRRPTAVLLTAGLASFALGVLADAMPAPSPTASVPALHEFYGVEPVPPPMPKVPAVGKLGGSLAPAKLAGGPVAKETLPNTGTVTPPLCLEDRTNGFPVAEAAAEFEGIVEVVVADDCSGYASAAWVQTVLRDEGWSGWYNAPSGQRDGAALISLNVGQAFRLDPHAWEMILAHEIGHALRLAHTHGVPSVMDPLHYADVDGLTDHDRAQLEELYP